MYHMIFKDDASAFSEKSRDLIVEYGDLIVEYEDWYMGEYFSYFRIWGSKTVHLLMKFVLDRMVLQEFSFQTVIDGTYPKLAKNKRKGWPRFPLSLDCLVI